MGFKQCCILLNVGVTAAALSGIPRQSDAQLMPEVGSGTVTGVVVDSVRGGVLDDAVVTVAGTESRTTTDSLGFFRMDGVAAGVLSLRVIHPRLDTLGISVVSGSHELRSGEALAFRLGVPSPRTLASIKCSQNEGAAGTAALLGIVTDADTDAPSEGAEVIVRWTDYRIGGKTIESTPEIRSARTRIDGTYLVCGIPNDLATGVIAVRGADSTAAVTISFERGLAIQSFSLPGSMPGRSDELPAAARPTASLRGSVIDPAGKPVSGARVSIEADNVATLTDEQGRFTLIGARSGTRGLTVRKIGFEPIEIAANLTIRQVTEVSLQLKKPVRTLETVRVTALRDLGLQRVGFTQRQRVASGKFYTPIDLERRNGLRLNHILETAPMLRSRPRADGQRYINGRGWGACIRYYLDGKLTTEFQPTDLEMLPNAYLSTSEIGAIEVYDKMSVPGEFIATSRSGMVCSIVAIWTKWKLESR